MESKAKCKEFPEIRNDFNMMVTGLAKNLGDHGQVLELEFFVKKQKCT